MERGIMNSHLANQDNPNATAQTTPDNSYAGLTVPIPSGQNPTAPTAPVNPETPTSPTATPQVPTQPAAAAGSPHDDHVAMFDKILRMVNPGTSYVDPTGKR